MIEQGPNLRGIIDVVGGGRRRRDPSGVGVYGDVQKQWGRGFSAREGFFTKEEFRCQANRDTHLCPANAVLSLRYIGKIRDNVKIDYVNRKACPTCAPKPLRTTMRTKRFGQTEGEVMAQQLA